MDAAVSSPWTITMSKLLRTVLILVGCLPAAHNLSGESSYRYLSESTLRVTSIVLEPYLMPNPARQYDPSVPEYVGFIPDLLREIGVLAGIDYVISTAPDNSFGYRTSEGTWDGMIGQLVRQQADIAAGPMYHTSQRAEAVDFTIPFLNVQATLLFRKPPSGTDLHILSVEDLINQSEIVYGTLDRGVIIRAFRNTNVTTERIMWRNMRRFVPDALTETNEAGIARVRSEKYAFVIPHTIGEYMALRAPCDLTTVGRFLMKRGYRLALGKQSRQLLDKLNSAIETLQDTGRIDSLYRLWWQGESQCKGGRSSPMQGSPLAGRATRTASSGECCVILTLLIALSQFFMMKAL